MKKIPKSNCARKKTINADILIRSRNGDRKIIQYIRITSQVDLP